MLSKRVENRFQAALIHLLGSIFVATLVLALVFLVWYPGEIATASGVEEIFLIILIVDVCLGPLLTYAVFNPKKKELPRDLAIIVMLQVSALLYGIHTVGVVRPAYVVFELDRFQLVYANKLTKDKRMEAKHDEYKKMPYFGPKWVTALTPQDVKERNEFLFSVLEGGEDLAHWPRFYAPLNKSNEEIINKSRPLEHLKPFNAQNSKDVDILIKHYKNNSMEVGFLPLKGFALDLVVIIDKSTAKVLELVNLRPW